MPWFLSFLQPLIGQGIAFYYWAKIAASGVQAILAISALLIILGFIWLVSKQPHAGLGLVGILLVAAIYFSRSYIAQKPCPKPAEPPIGEVSASWTHPSGWDRWWMDRSLPREWKPYNSLIRVRTGPGDLFIVFKGPLTYVKGPGVKAIEPVTGTPR